MGAADGGQGVESIPIWQWSAVATAEAIKAGRISAEEVTAAHVERLHTANPPLNAVVVDMTAQALEAARAADARQARGEPQIGRAHV